MISLAQLLVFAVCVAWKPLVQAENAVPSVGLRGTEASVTVAGSDPAAAESLSSADEGLLLLKSPFGQAFGIALGSAMVTFAGRSIKRTREEKKRIQQLFDDNTSAEQLQRMADAGKPLPSLVIIRGVASADGADVQVVSPKIDGLKSMLGQIDQPANEYIELAQMAKNNPNMKGVTDNIAAQTGIRPSDIPDVRDDFTHARRDFKGDVPLILSEILVARLCPWVSKTEKKEDDGSKKVTIERKCRKQSYTCFYARRIADGFHILDMQGGRIELKPPSAELLPQFSPIHHGEAPSLFLPTANVQEEFFGMLRKEGLTVKGQHIDFSNLPASKITDPDTLLSKFIFVDKQSATEMGGFGENASVLRGIGAAYPASKFLWEPRGFYDKNNASESRLPDYVPLEDQNSKMVGAAELLEKASRAASLNSEKTPYCEPTFSRESLRARRNEESCFRITELAIPRGSDVTILGKPVTNPQGKVMLVPPNSAEDGADVDNPDAQRYRFRILKGHTVENLLKQRSVNILQYYGFAVVGVFLAAWAAADYPGLTADS